jgi:polysaccharide chain length determinant protein (PEP-CTERM system associated)
MDISRQVNEVFGYLHGLWRHRWSGLLVAWLVALLGWAVVDALPNQYRAEATVNVDTSSIIKPLLEGLSVEADADQELAVMTRFLLSRDNLLSVMHEAGMDLDTDTPAKKEVMLRNLARSIDLKMDVSKWGPTVYEIACQSASPERAYQVVTSLLNTLVEDTLKSSRSETKEAEAFLDEQIKDYEQRLNAAEQRLADFKKKNIDLMPDEKGGYYSRVQSAQQEIEDIKFQIREAQQRYTELHKQVSGESPLLGNDKYSQATANTLRRYKEQLADLLTQYTNEHPDVQALRAKIADLEAGRTRGVVENADGVAGDMSDNIKQFNPVYQELKVQESKAKISIGLLQIKLAEKQKTLETLKASIDTMPQVEAELSRLNRDYNVTKERYLSLVQRRESARLSQKVGNSNSGVTFRVIEKPRVPIFPSAPNRPLFLAAVLGLSLAAGFGWCLLMFLLFPTFVDVKQLRKMIDLPVLGSISLHMGAEQIRRRHGKLITFLVSTGLLLVAFGAVLIYRETASTLVRAYLGHAGISL